MAAALQGIVDLLLAGGYFRARIASLPAFDKLIGGLAWCLVSSDSAALLGDEFNLNYDEDAKLGEKIRLSEHIEKALQKAQCPNPLQAHQIQGLDYPAIFPVVQWLVKRVIASREQREQVHRQFALQEYSRSFGSLPLDAEEMDKDNQIRQYLAKSRVEFRPKRQVRRIRNKDSENEALAVTAAITLREYGHQRRLMGAGHDEGSQDTKSPAKDGSAKKGTSDSPRASPAKGMGTKDSDDGRLDDSAVEEVTGEGVVISGKSVKAIVRMRQAEIEAAKEAYEDERGKEQAKREAHRERVQLMNERIQSSQAARDDQKNLLNEVTTKKSDLEAQRAECQSSRRSTKQEIKEINASVDMDPEKWEEIVEKVALLRDKKEQEKQFKTKCREQKLKQEQSMEKLQNRIMEEQERLENKEQIANDQQVITKYKARRQELLEVNAKQSRKALLTNRRIDETPSRTELLQYEKRFMELYDQIQAKHEETKRYYSQYNTTTDNQGFINKEISLLNSIQKQFTNCLQNSASREEFRKSLETIASSVTATLAKQQSKLDAELKELENFDQKYSEALSLQRQYFALVREFQDECARGEKLRNQLVARQGA